MEAPIYAYTRDVKKPKYIMCSVLGADEILGRSCFGRDNPGIEFADLYENNEPHKGGLADPRFGPFNFDSICATCGYNSTYCDGHFGHMKLAEPFYHYGFVDHVKKILECICLKCCRVLIHKNENLIQEITKTKSGKSRLAQLSDICKNISICVKCGTHVSKIRKEYKKTTGSLNLYAEFDLDVVVEETGEQRKKIRNPLSPEIIYQKLKNISYSDCILIGLNPEMSRPENMIHTIFGIPPLTIRPSARGDFAGGTLMEDKLTHRLIDIVRANLRLMKKKETEGHGTSRYAVDDMTLCQIHINAYFDSETLATSKAENKITQPGLVDRIKGKEGRIRYNLEAKRTDFTARTVITSDPVIDYDELRVPLKIAMTLTFPEVVTPHNIDTLRLLVRKGRNVYPGANFVFPASRVRPGQPIKAIDLRIRKEQVELRYGDIVERHLQTGDIVLLNRQPTLHKLSMMGHRIKVINNPDLMSFGLSVAVTKPYNADFDGDEMNIFVPQSIQTQIELEEIANVTLLIISPSTSRTSIGIVQDGLISAYNLTQQDMKIDWRNTMNLLTYTTFNNFSDVRKDKIYTGHELFSNIIPPNINLDKGGVKVLNSKLLEGRLSKDTLGEKKTFALHQLVWDEWGAAKTTEFINNTQKLTNNFNLYNGFTIGYGDLCVDKTIKDNLKQLYNTIQLEINHMIAEIENNPALMDYDVFEFKLSQKVNGASIDTGKLIVNNLKPNNNFAIMINCGSKGSTENIGIMSGGVGKMSIEGGLAPKNYNNRTLPYFHQNDDRGLSRAMITESLLDGMKFESFVFGLMASREGCIEQAIKTADSGYAQRRIVKSLEDVMVTYDFTVRTANNILVQLVYGDSGADVSKQYEQTLNFADLNNSKLEQIHKFTTDELKILKFDSKLNDEIYNNIKSMRDEFRTIMKKAKTDFLSLNTKFYFPCNMTRIINSYINNPEYKSSDLVDPNYVYRQLEYILDSNQTKLLCMTNEQRINKTYIKNHDDTIFKTFFKMLLYDLFSPKRCCIERKLNKKQFDKIIEDIVIVYNKSLVEPGEMIGIIAAQAAGEPLTQMTINAFHLAGVKTRSILTVGVPRMKECLGVAKKIKTPQMAIQLIDEFKQNKEMAHRISSNLLYTTLGDIKSNISVYYDPNPLDDNSLMKQFNIGKPYSNIKSNKNSCLSDITGLDWLIQIELSREKLLEKEMSLIDIKSKLCLWWERRYNDSKNLTKEEKRVINKISNLAVLSNLDNDIKPIIHIRFSIKDIDKTKDTLNTDMLNEFIDIVILNFKLKGLEGIASVDNSLERYIVYDSETGEKQTKEQYMIFANGNINLIDIRYLTGIDLNTVICNSIVDVYNTFGIEIARTRLLRELAIAYEGASQAVSYTHLSVLVDVMTYGGILMSIDRHGMSKSDADVLCRSTFEKAVDQLLTASVFGEKDSLKGVSARIMTGLVVNSGTGLCDTVIDVNMIEQSEYTQENKYKTYTEIITDNVAKDILNNNNDDIFIPT